MRDNFTMYGEQACAVFEALLDKYADEGIEHVEDMGVLNVQPISDFGTAVEIIQRFGGKEEFLDAFRCLERAVYTSAA